MSLVSSFIARLITNTIKINSISKTPPDLIVNSFELDVAKYRRRSLLWHIHVKLLRHSNENLCSTHKGKGCERCLLTFSFCVVFRQIAVLRNNWWYFSFYHVCTIESLALARLWHIIPRPGKGTTRRLERVALDLFFNFVVIININASLFSHRCSLSLRVIYRFRRHFLSTKYAGRYLRTMKANYLCLVSR